MEEIVIHFNKQEPAETLHSIAGAITAWRDAELFSKTILSINPCV